MANLYRIRDFEKTFLTDKTRGRKGRLKFLQLPVKLDDIDYIRLAKRTGGAAALGVWMALLELAGTLHDRDGAFKRKNGQPMTIEEMSSVTRISETVMKSAIRNLESVGWIVSESFGTVPKRAPTEGSRGEGRGVDPPSPKECDFADEIASWNGIAKRHGLPTVRSLTGREQSSLRAMMGEVDDQSHLVRAFEEAAATYGRLDGKKYGLRNLIRAGNRGQYVDASRNGREPSAPDRKWEQCLAEHDKLARERAERNQ